jgi:hypothetical protein
MRMRLFVLAFQGGIRNNLKATPCNDSKNLAMTDFDTHSLAQSVRRTERLSAKSRA